MRINRGVQPRHERGNLRVPVPPIPTVEDAERNALKKMIAPNMKRPVWRGGVLQIWITRACDKSCYSCTQGSNLGGKPEMITPEQFEQACLSLKGYWGVVGMFGGNPTMHPQFDELCMIMRKHISFEQRGLWCNNLRGKGATAKITFNPKVSNLNVHKDQNAWDEFIRDWPECRGIVKGLEGDSRHTPPYVAMKDIIPDEIERWGLISKCDINQLWSAMIGVFRGQPKAWFCEIAAAQAMLHQHDENYPDTGMSLFCEDKSSPHFGKPWWLGSMEDFAPQVRKHCHECGIPLKSYGNLACDGPHEQVSQTHADIYKPKQKDRKVELVVLRSQLLEGAVPRATDYIENGKNFTEVK